MAEDNPLFTRADASLVISGIGIDDDTFTGEFGGRFLTYNVTRARRNCERGKHGGCFLFDLAPALEANRKVEVDPDKVERFMRMPWVLETPLILVIENGAAWLIDGHHRLRALSRMGASEFMGWVIEEQDQAKYLVLFNGAPEMPESLRHPAIIGKAGDA
jgi:hypothetical protein